jgi:hypothetical protein
MALNPQNQTLAVTGAPRFAWRAMVSTTANRYLQPLRSCHIRVARESCDNLSNSQAQQKFWRCRTPPQNDPR